MRKVIVGLLVLFLVLGVACTSGGGGEAPTAVPVPNTAGSESDSPREAAPLSPGLPPTWTPVPENVGVHLPGDSAVQPVPPGTTPVAPLPDVDTSDWPRYEVQRGDTLGEIAKEFGVTISAIAEANGIVNIDVIEVGTILLIPPKE
ncbi:MAG: LysM peptidoglycan-binding domain-containing protein [Anaerolineae bacterium]